MQSLTIGDSLVGKLDLDLTHLFHEGWDYRWLTMSDWLVHVCWESELQPHACIASALSAALSTSFHLNFLAYKVE